jgi:hypothetical protein
VSDIDLTTVGGRRLMQSAPDGGESWDFGYYPTPGYCEEYHAAPSVHASAPLLRGRWDGATSISHWDATKLVRGYWPRGEYLPAQRQPRGTCVARGGSGALNVRQCIQIALLGTNEEFKPVSHSALYGEVRELGGIRGNSDGAMGADAAKALARFGGKHQAEVGEPVGREGYYSDDLAVRWGAGRGGVWTPENVKALGADNKALDVRPVRSAQEAADVIASLGVFTVASDQGFTTTRDASGVCRPRGTWMHQMFGAAVVVLPDGRRVFGIGQSWGDNVPDGPTLWHCPDYVFGVEWDVLDRMLRQGDSMGILAFDGWDNPTPVIPWAEKYI